MTVTSGISHHFAVLAIAAATLYCANFLIKLLVKCLKFWPLNTQCGMIKSQSCVNILDINIEKSMDDEEERSRESETTSKETERKSK